MTSSQQNNRLLITAADEHATSSSWLSIPGVHFFGIFLTLLVCLKSQKSPETVKSSLLLKGLPLTSFNLISLADNYLFIYFPVRCRWYTSKHSGTQSSCCDQWLASPQTGLKVLRTDFSQRVTWKKDGASKCFSTTTSSSEEDGRHRHGQRRLHN